LFKPHVSISQAEQEPKIDLVTGLESIHGFRWLMVERYEFVPQV
jgi:hypothetical protein